jgi:hypothetical protein
MTAQQETQKTIATQSQLKFIADYARQLNINLTLKEMVGITNVMVDYCMDGYSTEIGKRLDAIDKFIVEKFEEK